MVRRLWLTLVAFACLTASVAGQTTNVRATDPNTGATTQVGDAANQALRVNIVAGAAAGGTSSSFGSGVPSVGTAAGFSDGTNLQLPRVFDLDSSGSAQYVAGMNLRRTANGGSAELLGQGTMSTSLPVAIASDQTALPVTQSGGWSVRTQDGAGNALTSFSLGGQRSLTVAVVDGSGVQITSFGGAGGTASNFGSGFPTPGTAIGYSDGTNMQGARVVDLDTGAGTVYAQINNLVRRASGGPVELIGSSTSANSLPVVIASDQSALPIGTISPGSGATNLGKLEDAAHTTGDLGIMTFCVRQSTATDLSSGGTNGDYEPCQVDANGRVYTNPFPASPAAGTYLPMRLTDGSNFATLSVDYLHDSALTPASTSGPVMMFRASAAAPTNVSADNDAVMPWGTRAGALVTELTSGGAFIPGDASLGLKVQCTSGCGGSGGTSAADRSSFTAGSTSGTPMMAVRDDTSPATLAEDLVGLVRQSTNRELYTVIRDAAGNNRGANVDASGNLAVIFTGNPGINLAQVGGNTVATVATGVAKVGISDSGGTSFLSAANALNSTGGGILAVGNAAQFDDTSPTAITENQFGNVRMSANRNQYQTIRDAAGNERGVNVTAGNALVVDASATTQPVSFATTGHGTAAAAVRVELPTDGTGVVGLNAGTALVGYTAPGATATTTNSKLGCYLVSAASTNATSCKGSAGNLFGMRMLNTTTTVYYLRLYNTSAAPTCSSATGFIESIPIPPASAAGQVGGYIALDDVGIGYGTGIGFCLTAGSSSTDNTNAAVGLFGAIYYK